MRCSARDVAVFRAHARGIPIVLGSATPSLESWANATDPRTPARYGLLTLKERQLPPPACRLCGASTRGWKNCRTAAATRC